MKVWHKLFVAIVLLFSIAGCSQQEESTTLLKPSSKSYTVSIATEQIEDDNVTYTLLFPIVAKLSDAALEKTLNHSLRHALMEQAEKWDETPIQQRIEITTQSATELSFTYYFTTTKKTTKIETARQYRFNLTTGQIDK